MPQTVRKGLFVFSDDLSGINRFLLASLRERGWDLRIAEMRLPKVRSFLLAARSVSLDRNLWRRDYHAALNRWLTGPSGLAWRSLHAERQVALRARPDDIIMQLGGVFFAPDIVSFSQPYITFKDYTTQLALRHYPRFLGLRSEAEIRQVLETEACICRSAAVVFTASDNTRQSVITDYGVEPSKVVTVGEGLNFDDMPVLPRQHSRDPNLVLFVGKDFERKGGEVLLEAFSKVRREVPGARLLIVGPDRRTKAHEGVAWAGTIRDRDLLRRYFEGATLFVMPSLCEPFGLVFLEAMAHALPCIGTATDAMPEIIEDEESGFLVPVADASALAIRIVQLLRDSDLARRMGERGRQRVQERFRWSDVAARMDTRLSQAGRPNP